jgi:tetratricopeptide (TPR) repeat protein
LNRRATKILFLVVLIVFTPAIRKGWAEENRETVDPALRMGDQLVEKGALDQAITEYKRVLFLNRDEEIISSVHAKIASCYRAQQRWPEVIFHLRRSIQTASSLREIEEREFDLVTALLASGRDNEAELHLLRLREFSVLDERRVSLYLTVTYTYRGQWEKAIEQLHRAFPAGDTADVGLGEQVEQLELLFNEALVTPRKSPSGAAWLSTAVPGAGQLYAGDPWDALNAFVVNACLVTLILVAVEYEWYLEGAILLLYPLRRYYLGNRQNARLAAERRNLVVGERYRQQLLDRIGSLLQAEQSRRSSVPPSSALP